MWERQRYCYTYFSPWQEREVSDQLHALADQPQEKIPVPNE